MLTNIPKGTKDLLPNESYKWQYIEEKFQRICKQYGFKEIRTPLFEHTELFKRGIGDTSDVVQKEMYTFEDLAHRSLTLKPEGTSPVVRAFIEHKLYAGTQPTKMFYNSPCFRYEKPQAGRFRQFHQLGLEVFGSKSTLADVEVISLANRFLTDLGLKNIELHINSIGCPSCRKKYREALQNFLMPKFEELCETCKTRFEKNPMRILDCKSRKCQSLLQNVPVMLDYLCDECKESFDELKKELDALNIKYVVDTGIVRGLDYYTKTAFEFVTNNIGAQSTVCGGGRYDNLIEELEGPPTPGVGFGLGIERLLLTMEAEGVEIPNPNKTDVFVAFVGEKAKQFALKLNEKLLDNGFVSQIDLMERNIKGQLKYADKLGTHITIIIGDDELDKGTLQVKNMRKSLQEEIKTEILIDYLEEQIGD